MNSELWMMKTQRLSWEVALRSRSRFRNSQFLKNGKFSLRMANSPVFCAKREWKLLQSWSDQWSRSGSRLLNFVEKALPRYFGDGTESSPSFGVLQMWSNPTERRCEPKAGSAAFSLGEIEFPGTFGHAAQCYLKGRFVQRPNYNVATCYSCTFTATQ